MENNENICYGQHIKTTVENTIYHTWLIWLMMNTEWRNKIIQSNERNTQNTKYRWAEIILKILQKKNHKNSHEISMLTSYEWIFTKIHFCILNKSIEQY